MTDGIRWDDEPAAGTTTPTLTRLPATKAPATNGVVWDDQNPQPAPTLKPPSTANHSTLGDLGRRALGAASTGVGELVQAYGDIGKKVEQALPFTASLHRAQGVTPQAVQDIAKGIEGYGERESANVSPEYAKKTSVGLTAPGGLSLTNLADKAVTTVAGMAPALAGTVAASALGGPAAGVAAGSTLFGLQGEAAGRNAGEQQAAALTEQQLQQIPAYQNYLKAGLSPAQARAKFSEDVANRQALTGGAFGAGLGLVGEIPGVNAVGKAIASKLVRPIGARAAQAIGKGVAEGAGFAGINAAGQVASNVTNPIPTPATQGVGEAAASGLLPGFVLGGARGVLTRPAGPVGRAAETARATGAAAAEPNPGAAPGSLSDAANVLHRTAPPAPEPAAATNPETTPQSEGLRLRVEPIAVPWVDKTTGAVTPPSDNQVLAALHAMRDQADAIKDAGNKPTMSTPQVAAAWGIAPDRLRKLQSAMTAERRKGVTTSDAEARAAQEPQLPIDQENPADTLRATGAAQDARLRDLQTQLDQTGETLADIRARLEARQRGNTPPEEPNHVEQPEPQQPAASSASGGTGRAGGEASAPDVAVRPAENAAGAAVERTAGTGEDEAGQAEPVGAATPPAAENGQARAEAGSGSAEQASALSEPAAKAAEPATAQAEQPPVATPKPAEPKPTPTGETIAAAEQPAPSVPGSAQAGQAAGEAEVPSSEPSKAPVLQENTTNVGENQRNATKQTPQQQFEANKAAIKASGFKAGDRVSFMANGKRVEGTIAKGDKAGLAKDQGMLKVLVPGRNGNADYTVGARNLTKLENENADTRDGSGGVVIAAQGEQAPARAEPAAPGEGETQASVDVEGAARESAAHPENEHPEPTPAQHEAGNFKSGHVNLHGLDVTIQVPKGGMRRGTDSAGKPWEHAASDHYGHIRRTEGADGEPVDVYLGPHAEDPKSNVFVIDQVKPGTKTFDEHKAMVGFKTGREARASYDANFPKGLKTFGGIRKMSMDEFKDWVKHGDTTKPVTDKVRATSRARSTAKPSTTTVEESKARYTAEHVDLGKSDTHYGNASRIREPTSQGTPPDDAGRGRRDAVSSGTLDLFAPQGDREAVQAARTAAPKLSQSVKLVKTGLFKSGVSRIRDWKDAAHIIAPIRKSAQEQMVAVVADADGKPLAVLRHTVGLKASSPVDPVTIAGAVAQIPRARQVWFAHNHPSGELDQSGADRAITARLHDTLQGSGIEPRGMIVVGPGEKRATFYHPENVNDIDGSRRGGTDSAQPITAAARSNEVPAVERHFRRIAHGPRVKVRDAVVMREVVRDVAHGETGVMLLDNRHNVVGFLPMSDAEMVKLRTGDAATGAARVLRTASEANAAAVIPVVRDVAAGQNVNRLLAGTGSTDAERQSIRPLDIAVIKPNGIAESAAMTDVRLLREDGFFSRHIEDNGGRVVLATALTGKDFSRKLALESKTLDEVRERFGPIENWWRDTFGHGFEGLTQSEARAILAYKPRLRPDTLRNLVAKARNESLGGMDGRTTGRGSQSRPLNPLAQTLHGELARSKVQEIVDRTTAKWGDNQPRVRVVEDAEGLPASAKADPGYKTAEGYYDPRTGTTYLVASNLRSGRRALEVLAHEAIGHHGIENVVDQAFGAGAWQKVEDAIARLDKGGRASDTMRGVLQEAHRRYPDADPRTFAKEFLAVSAEKGIRNAFLDRVVTAIRKFLRQIMPKLQLNERELRQALVQADRYVRETTPYRERVAQKAAMAFSSKPDTFYSALRESVEAGKGAPKKADATAWKQWLDGAQRRGEFKGAEREWMGLDAWLDEQKGPITREALVQHVRDNQVRVQEVIHAADVSPDRARDIVEDEDGNFVLQGDEGERAGSTKFGEYTLPGGKNYRELLMTLPAPEGRIARGFAHVEPLPNGLLRVNFGSGTSKTFETRAAANAAIEAAARRAGKIERPGAFKSSHFDEPNIVAHVRMNDRTGPDGEKILHVEEVQSDWHQAGRRSGYGNNSGLTEADRAELARINQRLEEIRDQPASRVGREEQQLWIDRGRIQDRARAGVPDAPFKKTEQWSMLAMKRVLRYAAEHGYDKVTWTTGEQQAARYDLSKQVHSVMYQKNTDGTFKLSALTDRGNRGNMLGESIPAAKLEDYVGKDVAQRIVDGAGESVALDSGKWNELKGGNLAIGGEGMRAFYDKMLPNEIGKYVKKWGGKIGESTIDTQGTGLAERREYVGPTLSADRVREIARDQGAAVANQLRMVAELLDSGYSLQEAMAEHGSISSAEALGGKMVARKSVPAIVHSVDITPAMRESVLQGQPLFSQRALTLNDPDVKRRDALRDMPAIAQSDALAKYSGAALRTRAKASFDAARAAGPVHMMDGADVQFSRTGWREVNQHSADRRVLDVMPNIRELMQRAVPLWEDAVTDPSKPNLRAFRHYGVKVRGPDGDYYARFVVRVGKDGRYHYDHDAISTTALNDEGPARQPIRQPKPGEDATSLAKNRLAQWWRGVNAAMPEAPKPSFSRPEPADAERPSDPSREPHKTVKDIEAVLRHGDPVGVRDKAKAWLRGKLEDFRPAMLGAIQTRHLLELMEDSPPLKGSGKNYERSMQQMDADRQQLMAGAPDAAEHPNDMLKKGAVTIAQEMRQYAYGKGLRALRGRVRPEAQKLFDLMHAATIQRMDPDKAYERLTIENAHGDAVPWTHEEVKARLKLLKELAMQRGGDAWADREKIRDEVKYLRNIAKMERARERNWPKLQADWQALPEEAKQIYRQVRDWYSQYRDETEKALIKNIEALDMPETYRRSLVNRMRLRFEEARREGVYFPLNRDGAFWIAFRDIDGNEGFKMFESAREFQQGEKRLRAAGFQIDAKGRRDQNLQAKDAPSGTFVRQVIDVLQQAKVSESVQDEVYQTFLRSLPELSMRKHAIHRKNIAGYSEDALRAFAKNGYHGAHQLARLRHAQDMGFALEAMRASADNWRRGENATDAMKEPSPLDVAKADALVAEMAKRHDWIMHPTDQRLANMVNSLGFIYYLGASPASALANLTQVVQTVLPALGAEHGWGKATRVLGAAWRDAARTMGHMDRTLKDPDERRAFMVMQQRGDFSKTQSHTLAGLAEGNVLQTSPAWSRTMNAISWMFHGTEVINREATGMAAYRLARAKGMDFNKAIEYAGETNANTNFDYAAANRPRYMQGNVQRIALQFKNYSVGMSWLFYRNLFQAMKGETPEIRRVARRTVTGILGMTAILAGTTGLPVYNAVKMTANAANTLWGDDNEPWNFDDAFHRWLADNLGPDAARLIAEGPTNYLTGANIASRTSLSNLWIHDDDQRLEGADAYHALLEALAGPIGGIVNNWYVGAEDVRRGNIERGVERMLPTAVKNSIKSLRYAHEGVNSLRGDPIVPDVSGWQDFLQAIGFEPAAVANQYRINTAMKNYTSEIGDRRVNLMNAYALALKAGDDGDVGTALRKINAFNQAHPEVAITAAKLRASLRQRARLSAQATHGVVLNRRLALQAQQYAGVAQ